MGINRKGFLEASFVFGASAALWLWVVGACFLLATGGWVAVFGASMMVLVFGGIFVFIAASFSDRY